MAVLAGFAAIDLRGEEFVFQSLHEFLRGPAWPGPLLEGSNGTCYGVSAGGGTDGLGSVFRFTSDGELTILASFRGTNGRYPNDLLRGSDGNFYGTTGGAGGFGTVFRFTQDGILNTLFAFNGTNGESPQRLLEGTDGNLYGITLAGGAANLGTVFKLTPAGVLTTLASFHGGDGAYPSALLQGRDNNFYGTTGFGGAFCHGSSPSGCGTVFQMTTGGVLRTLISFNDANGTIPNSLVQGVDGNLYGTVLGGEPSGDGRVFRITPDGALASVVIFNGANGRSPGGLVIGRDGNFYGTTSAGGSNGFGTVFRVTPSGELTSVFAFEFPSDHGTAMQSVDGNLYGTARGWEHYPHQDGLLFKITPAGEFTALASFGSPGGYGVSAFVQAHDGDFYGTTGGGGNEDVGTAFKMTPGGAFTTLASFGETSAGPLFLPQGLIQARDGNFYGIASAHGISYPDTVFKMTPEGTVTTFDYFEPGLIELQQGTDDAFFAIAGGMGAVIKISGDGMTSTLTSFIDTNSSVPISLLQGRDGNLYGIAAPLILSIPVHPGDPNSIFKIAPDGSLTTLVEFDAVDGYHPSTLLQGTDGNLYGLAGATNGLSIVFKVSFSGVMSNLFLFDGANGGFPHDLMQGSDGNLYGLLSQSGPNGGREAVFRVTPDGALSTLMSLNSDKHLGRLTQGVDGNLYGIATTSSGESVFRLVRAPVLNATRPSHERVILTWNSFPGGAYRVEFKPAFSDASWTLLTPDITASAGTISVTDNPGDVPERYYRVRLLP